MTEEPYRPTGKEVPFAGGRYLLSHRLGNGSFGDIFQGYDTENCIRVAVKLEKKKARYPQLEYESKVYRVLHQPPVGVNEVVPTAENLMNLGSDMGEEEQEAAAERAAELAREQARRFLVVGIPQIFYYDSEGDYNIMVMELCGPSLEDLFNYCHRRFSLKTVLMVADQIIHRMQYIHERGFVHRDIKPENFVFGCGLKSHILYVIDFGLSKLYWDCRKNVHIPFVEGKPLTGTARYCSANTHRGYEQSRRDDLESIGFLFVYFLKGSLPWQGIQAKDQQLKTIKIGEKKIATPLEELCKGLPREFLQYCQYCRDLGFQQKPDYDFLRGLFRSLGRRYGYSQRRKTTRRTDDSSKFDVSSSVLPSSMASLSSALNSSTSVPYYNGSGNTSLGNSRIGGPKTVKASDSTNQNNNNNITCGYYDWNFDWFMKRTAEVESGGGKKPAPHVFAGGEVASSNAAHVGVVEQDMTGVPTPT